MDQEIIKAMKKKIKTLVKSELFEPATLHEWINLFSDFVKAIDVEADATIKKELQKL